MVPLGQFGYVKRDLPVYQPAFEELGFVLASRPQDGLRTSFFGEFDVALCLSFNTDHCGFVSTMDFERLGDEKKMINRIFGLRDVVWSKHKFCETMNEATDRNPAFTDFYFPCWVMPQDFDRLKGESKKLSIKRWISKPRSLGAGMGIEVLDSIDYSLQSSTRVVQAYLMNPHLIKSTADGAMHKWDMRTYVLITSIYPLRAYVYKRGLVRLATSPYSDDCKKNNGTACLTNTSINKKMEGAKLKDITWSFKSLQGYLGKNDYDKAFANMQRAVGSAMLASQPGFLKFWHSLKATHQCEFCYQLLGVDVIYDEYLNAKVIEINGEPSMQLTGGGKTHYDITKKKMAKDLVSMVFQHDESGALDALASFEQAGKKCGGEHVGPSTQSDARYLQNYFRERRKRGDFAVVYPNAKFSTFYKSLLDFTVNSAGFPKYVQKPMQDALRSHDVFDLLIHDELPLTAKSDMHAEEIQDEKPIVVVEPAKSKKSVRVAAAAAAVAAKASPAGDDENEDDDNDV